MIRKMRLPSIGYGTSADALLGRFWRFARPTRLSGLTRSDVSKLENDTKTARTARARSSRHRTRTYGKVHARAPFPAVASHRSESADNRIGSAAIEHSQYLCLYSYT